MAWPPTQHGQVLQEQLAAAVSDAGLQGAYREHELQRTSACPWIPPNTRVMREETVCIFPPGEMNPVSAPFPW